MGPVAACRLVCSIMRNMCEGGRTLNLSAKVTVSVLQVAVMVEMLKDIYAAASDVDPSNKSGLLDEIEGLHSALMDVINSSEPAKEGGL